MVFWLFAVCGLFSMPYSGMRPVDWSRDACSITTRSHSLNDTTTADEWRRHGKVEESGGGKRNEPPHSSHLHKAEGGSYA